MDVKTATQLPEATLALSGLETQWGTRQHSNHHSEIRNRPEISSAVMPEKSPGPKSIGAGIFQHLFSIWTALAFLGFPGKAVGCAFPPWPSSEESNTTIWNLQVEPPRTETPEEDGTESVPPGEGGGPVRLRSVAAVDGSGAELLAWRVRCVWARGLVRGEGFGAWSLA